MIFVHPPLTMAFARPFIVTKTERNAYNTGHTTCFMRTPHVGCGPPSWAHTIYSRVIVRIERVSRRFFNRPSLIVYRRIIVDLIFSIVFVFVSVMNRTRYIWNMAVVISKHGRNPDRRYGCRNQARP